MLGWGTPPRQSTTGTAAKSERQARACKGLCKVHTARTRIRAVRQLLGCQFTDGHLQGFCDGGLGARRSAPKKITFANKTGYHTAHESASGLSPHCLDILQVVALDLVSIPGPTVTVRGSNVTDPQSRSKFSHASRVIGDPSPCAVGLSLPVQGINTFVYSTGLVYYFCCWKSSLRH